MAIVFIGHLLSFFFSSSSSFFLLPSLLFYQKERCYGSEILNACMSYQKKVIYGKKSVTRPPLHITLCYNSRKLLGVLSLLIAWLIGGGRVSGEGLEPGGVG